MPFYSEELIEEVRSANDIVDVISGYVRLQKKGSTHFGLCPSHSERTPSFSVSQGKQMYYCFGCGAGGNVITFLMQYENATFQEAMETLAGKAGIELPKQELSGRDRKQTGGPGFWKSIRRRQNIFMPSFGWNRAGREWSILQTGA